MPSFTPHQACAAGPSESALRHTPAAQQSWVRSQRRRIPKTNPPARRPFKPGALAWRRRSRSLGQCSAIALVKVSGKRPSAFSMPPPLCLLPVPDQGHQRLATKVKTQVQGWQTSAVGSQFQTQHSASMARSARAPTETANLRWTPGPSLLLRRHVRKLPMKSALWHSVTSARSFRGGCYVTYR